MSPVLQKTMSLDDARKVYWLSTYPKPLGELLDQGYLNQSRLEWAAEKAYKAELRQAAQVILDWQKQNPASLNEIKTPPPPQTPLTLPITLEEARATLWTLRENKGQPMGMLVDTRQLTIKDLAYAIENAWDQRVRNAAIVLMSIRLQQAVEEPTPSVGGLHVYTAGRSFSLMRQFQYTLLEGVVAGFVIGILLPGAWEFVSKFLTIFVPGSELNQIISRPTGIIAFAIVIAIYVVGGIVMDRIVARVYKPFEKRIVNHRKGEDGEQRVYEVVQQVFDGQWHLFRNLTLPGENKADLDSVLVGPGGVWVLEVKNYTGEHRTIADLWEYRVKGRWKKARYNPSKQAQNGAVRLASFLRADNIKQWVSPVVVWANSEAPLTVENPQIAVWKLDRLADELGNLWQDSKLPGEVQQKIVEKLTKLCEAQIKARYED